MDLSKILFIAGKSGLFKLINQTKNGAIVEDIINHRRFPVFSFNKISVLENISMYTEDSDISVAKVFQTIYKKENGGKCIDSNAPEQEIRNYMEEILPSYDQQRVHFSDMKKLFLWYNALNDLQMIDLEEEKDENEEIEDAESAENAQ